MLFTFCNDYVFCVLWRLRVPAFASTTSLAAALLSAVSNRGCSAFRFIPIPVTFFSQIFFSRPKGTSEQPCGLRCWGEETSSTGMRFSDLSSGMVRCGVCLGWARVSETLCRSRGQPFAVQIEVGQSEAGAEPVVVLGQAAISGLLEAEDTFEYPEGMLDLGSHARLTPVLRAL